MLQIIWRAEKAKLEIDGCNQAVSRRYCGPTAEGQATDWLRTVMNGQARNRFQSQPGLVRVLNPDRIARMARDEIVAAGREGFHRVTEQEAFRIVVAVVDRELDAKADALEKLDAGRSDSIAGLALTEAARGNPQLRLDPQRLTTNAVSLLNRRFREALENGRVPDERLSDGDALGELAREVAEEFVGERLSAVRAVENLQLEALDGDVLRDFVARDDISPELASAMAGAYPTVRDELTGLGRHPGGPVLEHAVVVLRNAIMQALSDAAVPDGIGNQDAMRSCWGFLLAAGGKPLAGAIAERIASTGSSLGAVGAGIDWFLEDFLPSKEGQRLSTEPHAARNGRPICGIDEYAQAVSLSKTLNALAEAVQETGVAGDWQCSFGKRSADQLRDADIAVLRNLDIPIPAPDRRGTEGGKVWLQRTTLAEAQKNVSEQIHRMGNHSTIHGVLEDSYMQFDSAALNIDDDWLQRDRRSAVEGLSELCLNGDGTLNTEMLKTVSTMTSEETLNSVHRACFDTRRPDLAVFGGRPVLAGSKPDYVLESAGEGNVYLEIVHTGNVQALEFDHAGGFVHAVLMDPGRSRLDTVARIFIDANTCEPEVEHVVVSYSLLPKEAVPDARGHRITAPIPPGSAEAAAGKRFPPNFDSAGAIARLDQEIGLQRVEIQKLVGGPDSPDRVRMEAELDARLLSRAEFAAGRDPRHALRSRIAEMTSRYGADDSRTGAFEDTLNYFENSGSFAPAQRVSPVSLSPTGRSELLSDWRDRLFAMRAVVDRQSPRSRSHIERAQVLADAETYVQRAIMNVSSLRDPIPELRRHAAELEGRQLSDGGNAAAEATVLRTMAREYLMLQ
ncbi:MAG: hypothetical protein OXE40_15365 [Gammaproteobacteria bacterium]|nr:hypothetical protein [Gammaproteobacteria bacterium]